MGGRPGGAVDLDRFKRWMGLRTLFLKWVLPLRFPMILNIEPTNRCNLACRMCPRSISKRPVADMEWPLFEVLANELGRVGPILKVFLQKDGEPLLHPRIVEMVSVLRKVRAARTIGIISNGTLLTGDLFLALARAGLDDLIISIDAVDPEGYRELKRVDLYSSVVGNLREASRLKRVNGLSRPLLKARMVARAGKEAEIERFREMWADTADMVDITPFHTWIGAVKDERCYSGGSRYPCSLLWYTGVINSDGVVSPCCIDYECRGALGKIGSGGFGPIWNGRELAALRKRHVLGQYHRTPICGPCEYWQIKEDIGAWLRRKYRVA